MDPTIEAIVKILEDARTSGRPYRLMVRRGAMRVGTWNKDRPKENRAKRFVPTGFQILFEQDYPVPAICEMQHAEASDCGPRWNECHGIRTDGHGFYAIGPRRETMEEAAEDHDAMTMNAEAAA